MSDATKASYEDLAAEVVRLRTTLGQVQDAQQAARQLVADVLYESRHRLHLLTVEGGHEAADEAIAYNVAGEVVDALDAFNLVAFTPGDPS